MNSKFKFKAVRVLLLLSIFSRFSVAQPNIVPFSDAPSLQAALNSGLNPGDIVRADPNIIPIDLSILSLPLIIPTGVILEGDYDPIINPGGTHIFTTTRVDYSNGIEAMHMFVMEDGQLANPTTIRKLNISGPCWNW